ncbi:uncharacterized protein LOC101778996 [Setaria italica]|uniref:uncharacterized protein LOC101778996 n=1 Tax=Setaria italica TaxID=4555 RepID=UPI000BE5D9DE|nr:uncharacterized protein LOC101778996 [Setaria italica]
MHACMPPLRRSPPPGRPPAAGSEFPSRRLVSRRSSWLVGALQCWPFMEGGAAAAMELSPAWGSPAAVAAPSDHHPHDHSFIRLPLLTSLSPSAIHACMITFPLGSRLCMKRRSQERTRLVTFLLLPSAVLFLSLFPCLPPSISTP